MKNIASRRASFSEGPVRLYQEDLEELLRMMTADGRTVTIRSGDFEFESLDDLRLHKGDEIREISIRNAGKGITVDVYKNGVTISGDEDFRGDAHDARDLMIKRLRFITVNGKSWASAFSGMLMGAAIVGAGIAGASSQNPTKNAIFAALAAVFFVLSLLFGSASVTASVIYLKRRHEHKNFFKRYEAEFVKAGISLASGVVGYLIRLAQEIMSRQ